MFLVEKKVKNYKFGKNTKKKKKKNNYFKFHIILSKI